MAMVTGRTDTDTPLLTETVISISSSTNILTQSSTSTLSPSGLYHM